ncbi:Txe/YoeB family addiction module toxin [Pedobacter sp. KBS0701]|uniref:Txe/YoeB family addiction module toxin n=1 Tax=unclassified Pedobacter TaxID=2628915 RepID=UPI00110D8A3A|nr:Txe/YoeB family addiction module toxin [Pedobacter sp. KBS0701]QDW26767.1 Txe/YoeB family addiction module toxin [Pedobacter sp. KBS0701]
MEIAFDEIAKEDLSYWKKSGNIAIQKKIESLLIAILESPFKGIGKPEQLKYDFSGMWSRRINSEHRIIYQVMEVEQVIKIHSLRGHYK